MYVLRLLCVDVGFRFSHMLGLRRTAALTGDGLAELNEKMEDLSERFATLEMDLRAHTAHLGASRDQILDWLDAHFTIEEYERALSARLPGTCTWVLHQEIIRSWKLPDPESTITKFLWIHGLPGFGKTMLCATLIESLCLETGYPVAYFFCSPDGNYTQDPHAILRSWVAQLVLHCPDIHPPAVDHFRAKHARTATEPELWSLLQMLSLQLRCCYFIVDGFELCIDENPCTGRYNLNDRRDGFLQRLITTLAHTGSRVLIVSRDNDPIRDQFKSWPRLDLLKGPISSNELVLRDVEHPVPQAFLEYRIARDDTESDLKSFAYEKVKSQLPNKSELLHQELAEEALRRCDGMFSWIQLLCEQLSPGKTTTKLRTLVSRTPHGLEQVYGKDLRRILELPEKDRERAVSILRWVLFAFRPLTVRELTEALLIDVDNSTTELLVEDLPDTWDEHHVKENICRPCGSLLELRHQDLVEGTPVDGRGPSSLHKPYKNAMSWPLENLTVHFAHCSVERFLIDSHDLGLPCFDRCFSLESVHDLLAQTCLSYLCNGYIKRPQQNNVEELAAVLERYAFLDYAANSWSSHSMANGRPSRNLVNAINRLFDPGASRWILWADIVRRHDVQLKSQFGVTNAGQLWPSPLHPVAAYGLVETAQFLLAQGVDVNTVSEWQGSALNGAASHGHVELVKLLLDNGADPNSCPGKNGYLRALHCAMLDPEWVTAQATTQLLLDAGADIDSLTNVGCQTPLSLAVEAGSTQLCQFLLEKGANVHSQDVKQKTCLHVASQTGNRDVVEALLQYGADITALQSGRNALYCAAREDHQGVVDVLLNFGASAEAKVLQQAQALHRACRRGHTRTLRRLLQYGIDIEVVDVDRSTALHIAVQNGDETMVRLLLEHEARIEAFDIEHLTALHHAITQRQYYMITLLLDNGANIEARRVDGSTPLALAALDGWVIGVKLLVSKGANVHAVRKDGSSVLHCGALGGDLEVVSFLLHHKANPQSVCDDKSYVLHWAVLRDGCSRTAIKVLLELGIVSDPLQLVHPGCFKMLNSSSTAARQKIIEVLIERGADLTLSNGCGETVLHLVVKSLQLVDFLIKAAVDLDVVDIEGRTALHRAAELGCSAVVTRLVHAGSDVNRRTLLGQTPLHRSLIVRSQGPSDNRLRTVKSLLNSGADTELPDLFGERCSDWVSRMSYNVGLAPQVCFDAVRHPKPLPSIPIENFKRLHAAIVTVAGILLDLENSVQRSIELPVTHMWLQILGHTLIMADASEEASTALAQTISESSFRTAAGRIDWVCPCDQSKAPQEAEYFLSGYLFGCCSCFTVSLCLFCLEGLTYEETRTRKTTATCIGHFSVERLMADRRRRPPGVVNQQLETRTQWLKRLLRTYDCDRVLPCPNSSVALGNDKEIFERRKIKQPVSMLQRMMGISATL